ncbi:MAG TPA: hypothetical protein VN647_05350 [Nitrospira sp.]|nr:hypothetical protein [Nitrospira sp.]
MKTNRAVVLGQGRRTRVTGLDNRLFVEAVLWIAARTYRGVTCPRASSGTW